MLYSFKKYGITGSIQNFVIEFALPASTVYWFTGEWFFLAVALLVFLIYDSIYYLNDCADGDVTEESNGGVYNYRIFIGILVLVVFFGFSYNYLYFVVCLIIPLFFIHNLSSVSYRWLTFLVLSFFKVFYPALIFFYLGEFDSVYVYFLLFSPFCFFKYADYILKDRGGFRASESFYVLLILVQFLFLFAFEDFFLLAGLLSLYWLLKLVQLLMLKKGNDVILQETYQESHTIGLREYLSDDYVVVEFNLLKSFGKTFLRRKRFVDFFSAIRNVFLFLDVVFFFWNKNRLFLFIAPFDNKILFFYFIIKLMPKKITTVSSQVHWLSNKSTYMKPLRFSRSVWDSLAAQSYGFVGFSPAACSGAESYGFKRTKVIYHVVDDAFFNSCTKLDFSKRRTGCVVGFCGRLVKEKGIEIILALAERSPDIQFEIVGGGNLSDLVKDKSDDLSNLRYHGEVLDVSSLEAIYSKWDVAIMPSWPKFTVSKWWEDVFGLGLAEPMCVSGAIPIVPNLEGPTSVFCKEFSCCGFVINSKENFSVSDLDDYSLILYQALSLAGANSKCLVKEKAQQIFSKSYSSQLWFSWFN